MDDKKCGDAKDIEMVTQQLSNLHANTMDLLKHLEKNPMCPLLAQAWVQSKVTMSNAYLDSVRDYVVNSPEQNYKEKMEEYEEEEYGGDMEDGYLIAIEKRMNP